ncbi:MAG TPA: cation-transporting P-type ATPase, partial [Candidatus Saccharimonadales bacterium]
MMDDSRKLHYYRLSPEAVLEELKTNKDGLSKDEATLRLAQHGSNNLEVVNKEPLALVYLRQFRDLMIILLLASSLISLFLGDARTAIVLAALIVFNTTIGFLQEYKAGKVMESLEKLVVSTATVVRGGRHLEIATSDLALGDIVYLEEGNAVPADIRLIKEDEFSTNDFALTGESSPSRKFVHAISSDVPLAVRHNLSFMGTTVATGNAYGVIIGTGMHTELGRIANLSQDIRIETSPLQKEMNHVATRVTQGTMVLCVTLLPIAIAADLAIKDAFLFAVGIASSIIPQGLPAEINTGLAQAASKLAKAKALVKRLSAVETLGATNIICTDKTGTLTQNQMTVEQLLVGTTTYGITGKGYEPVGTIVDDHDDPIDEAKATKLDLFFQTAIMASNARINPPDNEHAVWYCVGDPTEGALVTLGMKGGLEQDKLYKLYPEIKEYTFDSARKRMSSVRHYGDKNNIYAFVKGAPESVLERCDHIWDHGKVRKLTEKDRAFILRHNIALAEQAMRNLGLAYREMPDGTTAKNISMDSAESKLVWLGMTSMIDPLREQVPNAMDAAHKAHIKVSIITGDHAVTAKAIALRARLATNPRDIIVVTGEELAKLSDAELKKQALRGSVIFSRVAPEDKLRIVSLLQDSKQVVAVTGDGINDAPALKRADIGVAMGLTGTDVAKQSADIVLLDDSFHTLVGTVQEGRIIFQNIRKSTLSAFTSNAAELIVNLLSLAAATALHIPLAISVMQILAIDLVAELFPIAALGKDKADGELMTDVPRNPKDHILNGSAILDLLWCGLLIGGLAFLNYIWFFKRNGIDAEYLTSGTIVHMQATALTYLTIVLCQLTNIFQRRTSAGFFSRYQFHNRQFWMAIALSLFCVANIIYNPWVAPYFKSHALGFTDWAYALGAAAIFLLIREFQRHNKKHHRKAVIELHRKVHEAKLRG